MNSLRTIILILAFSSLPAWPVEKYGYRVVDRMPQSREHFIQGLEIADGQLYISTGLYGRSRLLRYSLEDGRESGRYVLDQRLFAEGLTVLDDSIYQLTWRSKIMLVYQRADLKPRVRFRLPGEGWGLTNNGKMLIYSDGSNRLHFMQPQNGIIMRSIGVTEEGRPLTRLNELEWIDGKVWANIWMSNRIVMIDPANGEVTGSIDLSGLLPVSEQRPGTDVLNGIAYNQADSSIWVTGKRWPWIYRIELVPIESATKETPPNG